MLTLSSNKDARLKFAFAFAFVQCKWSLMWRLVRLTRRWVKVYNVLLGDKNSHQPTAVYTQPFEFRCVSGESDWRNGLGTLSACTEPGMIFRGEFTKSWIAYLFLIRIVFAIKLFVNKGTDLVIFTEWSYSRHNQKLKFLICDLLFMPFVKDSPLPPTVGGVVCLDVERCVLLYWVCYKYTMCVRVQGFWMTHTPRIYGGFVGVA